jgi:plastocyanin
MKPGRRTLIASFVMALLVGMSLPASAQTVNVLIRDYKFDPAVMEIRAGQTVKWTNGEKRTSHSIFFQGPSSVESDRLFPGESWERVFNKPGTYLYTCGPHPEMTGKVIVTE